MSRTARPKAYSAVQKSVGQRMMWVRELVEPNRSEVARWMDLDPSTLTKIEEGTRAPSIFTVIAYANKFRVSADFLLRAQLVGLDQEMERKLIALHPELVLGTTGTGNRLAGTEPEAGKPRRPKKPASLSHGQNEPVPTD